MNRVINRRSRRTRRRSRRSAAWPFFGPRW